MGFVRDGDKISNVRGGLNMEILQLLMPDSERAQYNFHCLSCESVKNAVSVFVASLSNCDLEVS